MLKQLFDSITQGTPLLPLDLKAKPAFDLGLYRELLEPIDDGVGIDLSYEDEYAAIQDQVSKCAEVDDSVVLGNATMLLRDRGKDLRAAVFMAYSSLRVDGLSGTLQVFASYGRSSSASAMTCTRANPRRGGRPWSGSATTATSTR